MAISKISFKESDITNKNSEKTSLVSQVNNNNRLERTEKGDNVVIKNKNKSEWEKYTLGGIVVLALFVVGDFLFAKGRHVKKIFGVKEAEEAKKAVDEAKEKVTELKDIISESLEDFTKNGNKFNKGKALTADSKPFTGNIRMQGENGRTNVFEYKNGDFV